MEEVFIMLILERRHNTLGRSQRLSLDSRQKTGSVGEAGVVYAGGMGQAK